MAIAQPVDFTIKGEHVTGQMKWNPSFGSQKTQAFKQAQMFVDSECLRYMQPLTPWLTGAMVKSSVAGTVIGTGHIVYNCVYARRQYYEHKARSRWFETMKSQKLETIKKGAAKYVSSD